MLYNLYLFLFLFFLDFFNNFLLLLSKSLFSRIITDGSFNHTRFFIIDLLFFRSRSFVIRELRLLFELFKRRLFIVSRTLFFYRWGLFLGQLIITLPLDFNPIFLCAITYSNRYLSRYLFLRLILYRDIELRIFLSFLIFNIASLTLTLTFPIININIIRN